MTSRPRKSSAHALPVLILSGTVPLIVLLATAGCRSESDSPHDAEPVSASESTARRALSDGLKDSGSVPVSVLSWSEVDSPEQDGWDTEVLTSRANAQLKQIAKLLSHPSDLRGQAVAALVHTEVSSGQLMPERLQSVYRDGPLLVQRPVPDDSTRFSDNLFRGPEGIATALRALARSSSELGNMSVEFKIFRVHKEDGLLTTRQYLTLSGHSSDTMIEQHATWTIRWKFVPGDEMPRIHDIDVTAFEQITRHAPQWFSDCTEAVLSSNDCYRKQLLNGYGHWLERIPHGIYLEVIGTPGMAVGDVNGDGLDDLYLCQERGLPNRLFLQQADGTVRDVSAVWGVDWLESSRAPLLIDLDNDGDQDLIVSVMGGVVLASNEDGKKFTFRRLLPTTEDVMSLTGADYDNDGDVDLYVCGYYADRPLDRHGMAGTSALPTGDEGFVMHDANVGGANHLLRNDIRTASDDWQFTDVTEAIGLDVNNRRFSFAASWEDFDNDSDQDLYVVNEFGRDNLYRNDDGHFIDVSDEARVEDAGSGMGITWGDYDRNGQMDVYISNMFSAAGNRITYQDRFKPDAPIEVKRRIQRLTRGNTLLQNNGNGVFRDQSAAAGVEMGRWSWDSKFVDLNNDGWLDLLIANGYITADDNGDL